MNTYVTEYTRPIKVGGDERTLEKDLPWFSNSGCLRVVGAGFKRGLSGPVPDQLNQSLAVCIHQLFRLF